MVGLNITKVDPYPAKFLISVDRRAQSVIRRAHSLMRPGKANGLGVLTVIMDCKFSTLMQLLAVKGHSKRKLKALYNIQMIKLPIGRVDHPDDQIFLVNDRNGTRPMLM